MKDGDIELQATVTRVLRLIEANDPRSAGVLNLYYGTSGAKWGQTSKGRLFSIWPVTKPGREILERARIASSQESTQYLEDHMLLAEECDQQKRSPNDLRAFLILQAERSARNLLDQAKSALAVADANLDNKLERLALRGTSYENQ
jgi:hypothetical protein